jgi:hypothetical protein
MNNGEQFFNTSGYAIERSLRFNSADSAYLNRTPASTGNRKTWTWAGWVKVSQNTRNWLFTCGEIITSAIELFYNGDLYIYHGDTGSFIGTTARFRDPSAWYHFVVSYDTTQTTAADRIRLYVNGEQAVLDVGTQPTQDYLATDGINSTNLHHIGRQLSSGTDYLGCYLADVHFCDGQALDPTSFGEFDGNGIWQPKAYTGSYGTNGFHLPFSDNSTAAALGTDTSGNGNDWTVNNISVAAGAGNDSLVDVPTNGTETDTGLGGEVKGNYCTLNPVVGGANSAQITFANGNLEATWDTTGGYAAVLGTIGVSIGKWYWETTIANTSALFGVATGSSSLTQYIGGEASSYGYYSATGDTYNNATLASYGDTYTTGDVIGIALDLDNGKLYFSKNGTWQNSGSPTGGTGEAYSGLTGTFFPAYADGTSTGATSYIVNFGQRPFAYTAPSGYKALCTANLPPPVITKPSEYMDVKLYTGNGSTQTISGLEFSPDLVWIKNRAQADNHKLLDTVRGATEELESNTTDAEVTNADGLTAFNSNGFDLGADAEYNTSTEAYVAWTWDAGSSTVTNTDGSITSSVRANPSAGFSVCTFTTPSSGGFSFGHGLGVAPQLVLFKFRNVSGNWYAYHASLGQKYILLNSTGAQATSEFTTAPTSTLFTYPSSLIVGGNEPLVAYCFAPVESYSAFGSYTGNGSADGPFVYTGFRPKFYMYKRTDTTGSWVILDADRAGYNVVDKLLLPDLSDAESTFSLVDFCSNGIKIRNNFSADNGSGGTFIYAAFAESPFQYARAR